MKFDAVMGQLRDIVAKESIPRRRRPRLLAEAGDGSMRDALSILDQRLPRLPTTSPPTRCAA